MFLARQFAAAAATASLLIAGACFTFLSSTVDYRQLLRVVAKTQPSLRSSPRRSRRGSGAPLRVIFAAEKPIEGELSLIAPNGSVAAKSRERLGGPPYSWFAEVAKPVAGNMAGDPGARQRAGRMPHDHARNRRAQDAPPRPGSTRPASGRCATRGIARPKISIPHGSKSCSTRRRKRRCHGRRCTRCCATDRATCCSTILASAKTRMKLVIRPDCADLPYFLRAYFAFKMGLPFGYSKCTRGGGGEPPQCPAWWNIQNVEPPPAPPGPPEQALRRRLAWRAEQPIGPLPPAAAAAASPPAATAAVPPRNAKRRQRARHGPAPAFGWYLRVIADGVHSGAGRTRATTKTPTSTPCR